MPVRKSRSENGRVPLGYACHVSRHKGASVSMAHHATTVYLICGTGGGGSGVGCCLKTTTPKGGRVTESV